jgi:hypothetical protein
MTRLCVRDSKALDSRIVEQWTPRLHQLTPCTWPNLTGFFETPVEGLISAGCGESLVVSEDICTTTYGMENGGRRFGGFSHCRKVCTFKCTLKEGNLTNVHIG